MRTPLRPALRALAIGALASLVACAPAPPGLELFVKTNHGALVQEISSGGGPALSEAMALAGVPAGDRAARTLQLQTDAGLYASSPGALVTALTIYGQ